ncbi:hypothetical protein DFJ74DRAFT_702633 [Hyaloraphidium curvatum]|nr:hypothetical protein DFJ74DRAFT_702633 [Hyaloraphidium curvatum]
MSAAAWKLASAGVATVLLLLALSSRFSGDDPFRTSRSSAPDTRDSYLRLLKWALTGSLHQEAGSCFGGQPNCNACTAGPYNHSKRLIGNDWPPLAQTMVGHLRLDNVRELLERAVADGVAGGFAELGVWRGGTCIFAKGVLDSLGERDRDVHVFDAFETLPGYNEFGPYLAVAEESVRTTFERYGLLDARVHFHRGLFNETLPRFRERHRGKLAVLRVDGNFYQSYRDALFELYELVPAGGFVIFDDVVSHPFAMRAWTDFRDAHGLREELVAIDIHSAWFRKTREVAVDFSKMRPLKAGTMDPAD